MEVAPLFDFGLGLFEHDIDYHGRRLEECISRMSKKPFGGGKPIIKHFDFSDIIDQVNVIKVKRDLLPNPLALEYLQYSLDFIGKELLLCD